MTVAVDIDDRIAKCQKILDQDPNSQIFAALAEALRKKGELDRAFRVCQSGLKIHPSYGSAHVVMAKVNLDRGLYDWAEAEVKKAIECDGESRATELLLAEIFIYKGEFNEAIKLLKRLHGEDPGNSQIKKLLDIAQRLPQEHEAAVKAREAAVEPAEVVEEPGADEKPAPMPEQADVSRVEILQQAVRFQDIQGALFINAEGLVVESEWAMNLDATTCGATFAELDRALDQELVKASFGRGRTILVENAEFIFYLVHVDNGMFLFVGSNRVNLGGLRMKIAGLVERYQPA